MTIFRCAIAPLDQSTTGLGWNPGDFRRSVPTSGGDWGWSEYSLQFLADPGTPIVAPFPVRVVSLSPFVIRPTVDIGIPLGRPYDVRINGIAPAVAAGVVLDKGSLLGRVAPTRAGGVKWMLWGPDVTFGTVGVQDGIDAVFSALGLDIVGAGEPNPYPSGFSQVPGFGGKLLARSTGPAGSGCVPVGALHGLRGLGSAAPAGYVDPQTSVYSRYGISAQSSTTPPAPMHENVSPARVATGGGILLGAAAIAGLVWWASRG